MNIGCCCTLAVKIQSAFYEHNVCFYCIQPWIFFLLSSVNILAKSHFAIFQVLLYCIALYCIALHCIVLCCVLLYWIVLYCIVLYCIALYCVVLYGIVKLPAINEPSVSIYLSMPRTKFWLACKQLRFMSVMMIRTNFKLKTLIYSSNCSIFRAKTLETNSTSKKQENLKKWQSEI